MPTKFVPYQYLKRTPANTVKSRPNRVLKLLPAALITSGSIVLANVVWPMISYQLFTAPALKKQEFISPVPRDELGRIQSPQTNSNSPQLNQPQTQNVLGAAIDYTDPANWFPQAGYQSAKTTTSYVIDIPKLEIENARVTIGGEDLNQSLIHYPGTANPGELGSPVIFGHSVLRQFYNPKLDNPNRYNSIFSKIMTLTSGDRIFATFDGIRYTYEVKDKVEVHPEDLFILEQRYNHRELKLITCVPEGTYLRRGVIIARLINLNQEL
jgi:sortase A